MWNGNKVLVLGAFGYKKNILDGQTIKTRQVYQLIKERYKGNVVKWDTLDMRICPWQVFALISHLFNCRYLVVLPAHRNLAIMFPVIYYLSKVFGYQIIGICIGGWQIEFFNGEFSGKKHYFQMNCAKQIKAFLPELERVNQELKERWGFKNTEVFPNFRKFDMINVPYEKHNNL